MDCSGLFNAIIHGEGEGVFNTGDALLWLKKDGAKRNHMAFYVIEGRIFHASSSKGVGYTNDLSL